MRISIAAATLALLLTACATTVGPTQTITIGKTTLTVSGLDGYNRLAVTPPDPNGPNLFVPDNTIVIDQEPVRPKASEARRVTIIWRLDASSDATYSFPDDGAIKLKSSEGNPLPADLDCGAVGAKKRAFVCSYTKPETPKQWKYSVQLKNSAGTDPTPLDPWIHQP